VIKRPVVALRSLAEVANAGKYLELWRSNLRGRRPVRADHRLRVDEKHIRAQAAILDKNHPKPPLFLFITVFSVRMRFLSVQKTRLARAARKVFGRVRQHLRRLVSGCP